MDKKTIENYHDSMKRTFT